MAQDLKPSQLPIVFRQSAICLGVRVILLQILFSATYLVVLFPLNLIRIPPEMILFIYPLLSIGLIILIILQVALTVKIFMEWLSQYYVIQPGEVLFKTGVFEQKEKIYLLKHIESITCNQNFFEKVFNYGTVQLFNPILQQSIHLDCINNPEKYISILEKAIPGLEPKMSERRETEVFIRPAFNP